MGAGEQHVLAVNTDDTQEQRENGRQDQTAVLEGLAQGQHPRTYVALEYVNDRLKVPAST